MIDLWDVARRAAQTLEPVVVVVVPLIISYVNACPERRHNPDHQFDIMLIINLCGQFESVAWKRTESAI